jgi:hypothetical protein
MKATVPELPHYFNLFSRSGEIFPDFPERPATEPRREPARERRAGKISPERLSPPYPHVVNNAFGLRASSRLKARAYNTQAELRA